MDPTEIFDAADNGTATSPPFWQSLLNKALDTGASMLTGKAKSPATQGLQTPTTAAGAVPKWVWYAGAGLGGLLLFFLIVRASR